MPVVVTKKEKVQRKSKRTLTGGVKHKIIINPVLMKEQNLEYETLDDLKKIIAEAFDLAQVEKETVEKHQVLNEKLFNHWRDGSWTMKPNVREALLKIAHTFIDTWKLPDTNPHVTVVDIIVTGSNANYNYTPYSDIDLHVVYDPGLVDVANDERVSTIKNLLNTKKQLWAKQHDIHVLGLPVELYAQIVGEVNVAGGTYSLMSDKWIKVPSPAQFSEVGEETNALIYAKSLDFMKEIDELVESKANEDSINEMLEKIHQYRVSGLGKDGEDSVENKVFKVLRNSGYIKKLFDYRQEIDNNDLSLNEDLIHRATGATAKLEDQGKYILFTNLHVPKEHRGKGGAHKIMNAAKEYADKQKKPLRLNVLPDEDTDQERLTKFYEKHGFKKTKGIEMVRDYHGKNGQND